MSLSKLSQLGAVWADGNASPIQSSQFLRLNVDCWENVFDYLSLDDILWMSKTCKRMQAIGGHYYRQNFLIETVYSDGFCIAGVPIRSEFFQFVNSLKIMTKCDDFLNAKDFSSLNKLQLIDMSLDEIQMACIKDLLGEIKYLYLDHCSIDGDLFERILKHCPKIKRLTIDNVRESISNENWLLQEYPMLERLNVIYQKIPNGNALLALLERNSNIKHLEINGEYLWTNRHLLIQTHVRLDCLVVDLEYWDFIDPAELLSFFYLLNSLYDHGFYRSLKLIMLYYRVNDVHELTSGMTTLKAFKGASLHANIDASSFTELTELYFNYPLCIDVQKMAKNLTKLKKIVFHNVNTNDILPFVQHSRKLNTIVLRGFIGGSLLMDNVLNLFALNQEREKLKGAQRVWIHVNEDIHLATKWNAKHLNLKLVEIKRIESVKTLITK